ncbi:hypothetical protein DNK59_12550 [Pseudomonas sp. TKO26]|jgi:hypothetical protein|uniref:Transcriptional regulator SutA RNAP-binding domain-containing protein n=1 Tax=Pseudomonas saponiphila TaxID=556534 RepID=A0A1H4V6D1_9PSED|nr:MULTISPECIES: hypothetical protein [Pseudomonas]MCE4054614.1 hypothetical protein [Pseudomonas sp. Au-Pse12]PYY86324.1 hypothetical protein DNK62_12550 [Pseudomonas sp. TKO30]PYY89075.1 hypothetical protein DNK61_12545 [Pseudomonas sp. TKO29]PYY91748.1 hypothetical protein DNK59_12550 [Pseudomonas sp. TKO26]PYY99857.1 hypothetical protein DNK60_12545 [Pseudomonas sp. TKO14]
MTTLRFRSSASKAGNKAAVETRESIAAHVAVYLHRGGQIQKIARGISGLPKNGSWNANRRRK